MSIFEANIKFLGGAFGFHLEMMRFKAIERIVSTGGEGEFFRFSIPVLGAFSFTSTPVE